MITRLFRHAVSGAASIAVFAFAFAGAALSIAWLGTSWWSRALAIASFLSALHMLARHPRRAAATRHDATR